MDKNKTIWIAIAVIVAAIISILTPPEGMETASMRFMGIFVGMIILLVSQALADWIVALIVLGLMIALHVDDVTNVIVPLGQPTLWLIFGVLAMAAGIGNSGIIRRIAYKMLTLFPTTYHGTILSMISTSVVLSPMISSSTAKATMLAPIATSLTESCGLKERSRGALGILIASFIPAYYFGNCFISGSANVGIMMGFMSDVKLDYIGWLSATAVWGITLLIGTYIFCMTFCKPKAGEMSEISSEIIKGRLAEMGPMNSKEKYALGVLFLALLGWISSTWHGIDAGTVAVISVALLAIGGLFTAQDLGKVPWTLILFIGMLFSVAYEMNATGVGAWLAKLLGPVLAPMLGTPWVFIPALCIITYLVRFVIVSNLANLAIMTAIFGPLMASANMSTFVLAFVVFTCGAMWNVRYQHVMPLTALAASGEKYVTFNEFRYGSFAYMIMCIVGMTASIPVWQLMGLIK